uniref:Uncharacterized protein n=1 Tax=Sphaerodactylus townsendi TaxID=933632 RepID=A0ACB8EIH1_9SAUR
MIEMTEDEQFALALKMSEQEARQLNSQEEEEEELLRKAIAESLSSCQPRDPSAAAALPPLAQAPESPVPSHPAGPGTSELLTALPPRSESPCLRVAPFLTLCSEPEQQIQRKEKAGLFNEFLKKAEMAENAPPLDTVQMLDEEGNQEEDQDSVHYYWGIPFCPKGVNPNEYTQVILCQLEVYQKSLKQAQRQLLQKKKFGEPVVPNSCSLNQNERGTEEEEEEKEEKKETVKGIGGLDEQERKDMGDKKEPEGVAWLLSPTNRKLDNNPQQKVARGENCEHGDEPTSSSCQVDIVLLALSVW